MITGSADFSVTPTHILPTDGSLLLCFQNNQVLLFCDSEHPSLPTYGQVKAVLPADFCPFELAHSQQLIIFCPHPHTSVLVPEGIGLAYQNIRTFHQMDNTSAALLTASYHLWCWYNHNRFCGRCGHPLVMGTDERSLICNACGLLGFPTIAPAVIVAITKGDQILLAQNAHGEFHHYALIAGYVEIGETLEHAVHREVLEEVGLHLKTLCYLGNQPWGLSGSQMFAFHAEVEGEEEIKVQKSELKDARWFARSELTPTTDSMSIAFELIERFRTERL